jgi:hypothetical protein
LFPSTPIILIVHSLNNHERSSLRLAVSHRVLNGAAPSKIQTATRHKSIDTPMSYAHEVDRERDPAEAYVDLGE